MSVETADPFDHPSFKVASLTQSINALPTAYGDSRKLFSREKKVSTRTILVEERNGVLTLIQSREPGSDENYAERGKRKVQSFVVPHLPLDDVILPSEYADLRGFGTTTLVARSQLVKERLETLKASHDITHEHLRMGAKKGKILDADGSVLHDLFAAFGIAKPVVYFDLDNEKSDVSGACRQVLRITEDHLRGDVMTGVSVDVSPEFFDKLIAHESVREVFIGHEAAVNRLGGDSRKGFKFGGLTFSEHRGKHVNIDGKERRFVNAGEGHAYPDGTLNTFFTAIAPADFNETAGTLGQRYYAKLEQRRMGRGYDLHSQSNILPLCAQPGVLVECKMGKRPTNA
ncbi:major capsid protein [Zooshikella sp. RANM57]|uniref:major capsid protein n=1 Tax=Zooshikella sp. RANM57 TaxID=3425863 RepID=UPI003D6F93E8